MVATPHIHHSNQGVQYAATAYVQRLQKLGVTLSMAAIGEPAKTATPNASCAPSKKTKTCHWLALHFGVLQVKSVKNTWHAGVKNEPNCSAQYPPRVQLAGKSRHLIFADLSSALR